MYDIQLIEQKTTPVLCIRTTTSMDKLPQIIGEGYAKIMARMAEVAEQPADVPYTAYYNLDMQNLDVEMGFPVARLHETKGDVAAREIPAGKAVTCLYKGPYSGMEAPYNEIFKWIGEHGLKAAGVYYEYYFNEPGSVPEEELLTKIVIPVE